MKKVDKCPVNRKQLAMILAVYIRSYGGIFTISKGMRSHEMSEQDKIGYMTFEKCWVKMTKAPDGMCALINR